MKLTKTIIEAFRYAKADNKADLRFDDDLAGFGVRVYPSQKKSFFVQYRTANGTPRRQNLGPCNVLSVGDARDMARDALTSVRKGGDPADERRTKRNEATLREFFEIYKVEFAATKRAWKDDQQRINDHILPDLGAKKLSSITQADIVHLRNRLVATDAKRPIRKRPLKEGEVQPLPRKLSSGTVNRVVAVLKHMLHVAERSGYIQKSPATGVRMLRAAAPRDVFLTVDQCRAIMGACDAEPNKYAAALIKVALFTGRRIGELRVARWDHLDGARKVLRVPDTKAGEQQFVHLDEAALEIIQVLPRIEGCPFIFVGEDLKAALVNYRKPWTRIVNAAGVPYMPPHGLRHNAASMMVANGVPMKTVGAMLGHKDSRTTEKYVHHRPEHLQGSAAILADAVRGNSGARSNGEAED